MSEAVEKFLVEEYVPSLLQNRSILEPSDPNEYVIKSCKVLPVTTDGTFMLSTCNRVKVDLQEAGNPETVLHLDVVVKVSHSFSCGGEGRPTERT